MALIDPIMLVHFAYVELCLAKQATSDLGLILAMRQNMGKILISITWQDGGSTAFGTT